MAIADQAEPGSADIRRSDLPVESCFVDQGVKLQAVPEKVVEKTRCNLFGWWIDIAQAGQAPASTSSTTWLLPVDVL